nr:GGDEF domain-containing protein [Ancylobacter crimeensis]
MLVGLALLLRISLRRQGLAERELKRLATTDPLTGLANRRRFDEALEMEWLRARADRAPLTVMMVDADHFKQLNDHYGHAAGDAMLRTMAGLILRAGHEAQQGAQRAGRPDARERHILAARIGGDEFAVIAPRCNRVEGEALAWAIREHIREITAAQGEGAPPCSVSVGVATDMGGESASAAALLAAADAAVYAAKAAGRDRVAGAVRNPSDVLSAGEVVIVGRGVLSPPPASDTPAGEPAAGEPDAGEPDAAS